ncbi:MAG: phytoene/squalene synthase family protein [Halobacteriota archaeon]
MLEPNQIARGKEIQQRTGKTFHLATRVLPRRVRHATYVLYGFFRMADEIVDVEDPAPAAQQRADLEHLRAAALGRVDSDDPVLRAFVDLREAHGICEEDVHAFIDAMVSDISKSRYATYDELESYMDGSAAAVGRMMTAVMDPDDPQQALPHATALGEAFQLTNFLRDVREDIVERDRIYLPQTTLDDHGVTEEQLLDFELSRGFAAAMESELHRAEYLYRHGVAGIKHLPEDCQFGVLLAAVLYADHHRLIRARGYDVLSTTPQLGTLRKLWLLASTRWKWVWNSDPETVFRAVSTIPTQERRHRGPERGGRLPAQ